MKRRELIKLGSTILGSASIGAITGYGIKSAVDDSQSQKKVSNDSTFSITPKQTAPYEYSSPMPFNKKLIDELYDLNQKLTKGKITVLYSGLPNPLGESIHPVFSSVRGENHDIKTIEDYLDYVKYAISKGFKCVYILNTMIPVSSNDSKIYEVISKVFNKFYEAGIHDVKLANVNIMHIFENLMEDNSLPKFDIHLSTTTEYHNIQTYYHILNSYPGIKTINISVDDNHNFQFLDSLRKMYPGVKLDILVNEIDCIRYCGARHEHECVPDVTFPCKPIISRDPYLHLARNNTVFPWHLEYYSALGINNFKFTCTPFSRLNIENINYIKYYLEFVEKGISEYSANDIMDKIFAGSAIQHLIRFKKNYSLAKFIDEYLPNIEHLIKHGLNCASECGIKCKYCYKFADKLREFAQKA